ncbi:hypothetical protein PV325_004805 [Microctonus aethiopoides]|nr:hypothetical protein PV326_010710 [Microctonus aethiopoides]KAK0076828.1 hypothetical protein PV325_004805 [Microctonus aethiopoides]
MKLEFACKKMKLLSPSGQQYSIAKISAEVLEQIHGKVALSNPNLASFMSNLACGTVSNALEKSKSTNMVIFLASTDLRTSNVTICLSIRRSEILNSSHRVTIGRVSDGDDGSITLDSGLKYALFRTVGNYVTTAT